MKKNCPSCGELLVHANLGNGDIDTYCEECGWPDECREPNPSCTICEQPGVGICGETWRCEEHWRAV